jgi:PKD repeat protein
MSNKLLLSLIASLLFFSASLAQTSDPSLVVESVFGEKGEIYFTFQQDNLDLNAVSRMLSIDGVDGATVYANANKAEFAAFLKLQIPYVVQPYPGELLEEVNMLDHVNIREITDWNFYPTYEAYVSMMYQFATDYPELCQVFSIGQSVQGRELLMAKVSKNVNTREAEPQFLYTGTMHGDETAGYVLLLRLIDYLLSNYGIDPKVTNLLDNIEIWINPNANPDGTYAGGNHTVNGATRRNANNVDLNRNFPDPAAGPNPDGNPWQPETILFMQLAEENNFVMSANTHGGAEVMNYPWDTWSHLTADNDWWVFVCRQYVDTAHLYSSPNYMNGFDNGITNGYAWYSITGGRQDYMNYFHNCREVTMELSNIKIFPPAQLPTLWDWNYRSLLNYIEQSSFGVSGTVSSLSGSTPLHAKVTIDGHDIDNSWVFTDAATGFYQRLLEAGTYDLTFSAAGHYPETIQNVVVSRYNTVNIDVQLDAGTLAADFSASATSVAAGGSIDFQDESFGNPVSWNWHFPGGSPANSSVKNPQQIVYQNTGFFDVSLTVTDSDGNQESVTKENYITVNAEYLMSNQTVTTCGAMFYDSGGHDQDYGNNEDFVMTFLPEFEGANIIVEFLSFDVEFHSNCNYDWLKIYNGATTNAPLIGTYCGTNSPGTIEADNATGALTFHFQSDFSVTRPGWEAAISCSNIELPPVADFTADNTEVLAGDTVYFTDLSQFLPDSWQWTFEGGTPATSGLQHPVIVYQEYGEYDVKLVVQNAYGADSVVYQNYILVDSLIGIAEAGNQGLMVYPNPNRDGNLHIKSSTPITEVKVYNFSGKLVLTHSVDQVSSLNLNTTGLAGGIYLFQVMDGDGMKTVKVMIGE